MFATIIIVAVFAAIIARSYASQARFEAECQAEHEARLNEATRKRMAR